MVNGGEMRLNLRGEAMLLPVKYGLRMSQSELDAYAHLLNASMERIEAQPQRAEYDLPLLLTNVWQAFGAPISPPDAAPKYNGSLLLPIGTDGLCVRLKHFTSRYSGTNFTGAQLVRYDNMGNCKAMGLLFDAGKVRNRNVCQINVCQITLLISQSHHLSTTVGARHLHRSPPSHQDPGATSDGGNRLSGGRVGDRYGRPGHGG